MRRIAFGTFAALAAAFVLTAGRFGDGPADVELTVTGTGPTFPTVAVAPGTGAVYAAWVGRTDSLRDVYLARLDPGADAFGASVRVNDVPGEATLHAQAPARVAAGPGGRVYVAWVRQTAVPGRRFPASDVRLARSVDGGRTFEPAVTVHEDAGVPTGHHFHDLAVAPDGTVYVSWLDTSERDRAAAHAEANAGTPQASHAGHGSAHGNAHGNSHGNAHGHAHGNPHGDAGDGLPGTAVRVARSTDGGRTFEPGVVVARGTCQCCRTALAVSADGLVYVAWRHLFDGGARDMAVARSMDGGKTFSAPSRVYPDDWRIDGCPHAGPALAVDGRGRVHVAWYTGVDGAAGLYHAVSADGGARFGAPVALAPNAPMAQTSAAPDASGRVWLAWEDPAAGGIRVAGTDGAAPGPTAETIVEAASPALAAGEGTVVLAWRADGGVRVRVERGR